MILKMKIKIKALTKKNFHTPLPAMPHKMKNRTRGRMDGES